MGKKDDIALLREQKKDYVKTFGSAHGKNVLKDLERMCFIHKTPYSDIPGRTKYNTGLQMIVIHIKNMMTMDIEDISKLVREQS